MHNGNSADSVEGQLLAAISTGNRSALYRLHFLYFPRLARFFARLTATSAAEIIDQLIADTMCDVWRTSATIASETTAPISIMRLAWARARARALEFSIPGSSTVPEKPRSLSEVLGRLQLPERAVLHLARAAHSREEIADILSMSCESVDDHLASARIALRDWLAMTRVATEALSGEGHDVQISDL